MKEKENRFAGLLVVALAGMLSGCAHLDSGVPQAGAEKSSAAGRAIQEVKAKYAPDSHLGIFRVGLQQQGHELVLTGDVDRAEARIEVVQAVERTGTRVTDQIKVLPSERLGNQVWGIGCVSVASARELPEHKAEMGTQVLMGEVVRVWKRSTNAIFPWFMIQAADGYVAWLEVGMFAPCTRDQVEAWNRGPLLMVTALEAQVLEAPQADGGVSAPARRRGLRRVEAVAAPNGREHRAHGTEVSGASVSVGRQLDEGVRLFGVCPAGLLPERD